jgi:MOSC domain-containing protein
MHTAPNHLSAVELEQGLSDVLASPQDEGRLEAIVVRPASDERRRLTTAQVTPENGLDGDRWVSEGYYKLEDGSSDPRNQLSLMNFRFLRQIAGEEDAMCLAGDNLIVDLDLSDASLPPGSRLAIGDTVVVELTELPHTGCSKFAGRYGDEARAFANDTTRKTVHLRGRYARTITGGTIGVGDVVRKVGAM